MPPRYSRLDFPKSVMDKGFTQVPNLLDELGLGPYHYRVLVFLIRWKGKATLEAPLIKLSLTYIARMTGISLSKVKEVIQDLERDHIIAVHRRRRLRNMYDLRPLFTALLKKQADLKKGKYTPVSSPSAVQEDASGNGAVPNDIDDVPGTDTEDSDGPAVAANDSEVPDNEVPDDQVPDDQVPDDQVPDDEYDWEGESISVSGAAENASEVRKARFGVPSHAPDDRIFPGMDDEDRPPWSPHRAPAPRPAPTKPVLSPNEKKELLIYARLQIPICFAKMLDLGHRPWPYQWATEFDEWVSQAQIEDTLRELQEGPEPVTARTIAFAVFQKYKGAWARDPSAKRTDPNARRWNASDAASRLALGNAD